MHTHCTCTTNEYSPITHTHDIGIWAPLPEDASRRDTESPRTDSCGCNEYRPAGILPGSQNPFSDDPLPEVPLLPLTVEYEDDDDPSDDHEYLSVKITEFADMVSALRSCTCQSDGVSN
jgi:hypothetical protein